MNHLKPFLQDPLPKTILPLTISLGCFLIERTLPNNLENNDPPFLIWSKCLKETIIEAYYNYTQFIVMMLVLSIMISIIRANFQGLLKRNQEKRSLNEQHRGIKQTFIWLCKSMIYYTILFCCYQAIFLMWSSMLGRHQPFTTKELGQFPNPSLRRLEEDTKDPIYVSDENHFAVYSPEKGSQISVMIELDKQSSEITVFQPYFMDKNYTQGIQVKNQKSSILLEGVLEKVNQALQEILIDLVGFPVWGGTISVRFRSNSPSPFKAYFKNISDYLTVNNLSIYISNENRLAASSLDNKLLLVTIQLEILRYDSYASNQPFFVNRTYPSQQVSFDNRNSLISIKGSLEEVNQILKEILIHADQKRASKGTIKITDGFSVPISRDFTDIFAYAKTTNESITTSNQNRLYISTTLEYVLVIIELDKDEFPSFQPSFMEVSLSQISNHGSSISIMSGKLAVNAVLSRIVLDLNGHTSWGGTIKFKNSMPFPNNFPFVESRYLSDISKYCVIKKEPIYVSAENYLSVFSHKLEMDLTVSLQLDAKPDGLQPYFLNKTYPSLKVSNKRSLITLTGQMERINQALGEEILVDLAGTSVCGGTISIQINDGQSPPSSLYFKNISDFFVKSQISISISNENQLAVSFPDEANFLYVVIDLTNRSSTPPLLLQHYFMDKEYPGLRVINKKYQMIFEGSPDKINLALKEILIDLVGFPVCNGTINITDKVSPGVVSYSLPNISDYLIKSKVSIAISNPNSLDVSSLFNNYAIVNIHLDRTKTTGLQPYFMDKEYPGLEVINHKYQITLEGSLNQINYALKELLIDPSGFPTWGGTINITDRVNPTVSYYFQNISTYLTHNNLSISIYTSSNGNNRFAVSSREGNSVLVTLQIDPIINKPSSFQPCFMRSRAIPGLQLEVIIERSLLTLEGPTEAINKALQEIFIDPIGMNAFGGTINATDGVNPLVSHYFSNILRFIVKTSISFVLSNENQISISALNPYQKTVATIKLDLREAKNRRPYFVSRVYSSLKVTTSSSRSLITLEGTLDDVNKAFKEITIYLDELSVCSGEIEVYVGSNSLSRPIKDLSKYFIVQKEIIYISSNDNRLAISSMSSDPVTVTLELNSNSSAQKQARFISKSYPSVKLDNRGSTMSLEGLPDAVNNALKEILIALDDQVTSCSGIVRITDGDNPYTGRSFNEISNYFISDIRPFYNSNIPSLQEQIDNSSLYTGKFSSIELNPNTFTDKYHLPLKYSLLMQDPLQEIPSWISIKGLALSVAPPEKYYPLSYQLVLVVENEAKQLKVPFIVKVNISLSYGLKVLATYCGYIITLFGSVIYANRIFNIVAKKFYRYPSTFKLIIGKSITSATIFPISFIQDERKESKLILEKLEEYAAKQVEKKVNYLHYFIDSHNNILDKQKILQTVKNLIPTLPRDQLKLYYDQTGPSSKKIIHQLILNEMVMRQLALKESKATKDVFNKIKNNWMNLVIATDSPSQFAINSNLGQELLQICSSAETPGSSSMEKEKDKNDLETKLLNNGYKYENKDIQMDLLKDAIIAHAFNFQNLNVKTITVNVTSYLRLQGSFILKIKGFFLKDLFPIDYVNTREIGCGIEYAIKKNTLEFFGTPNADMKEKIIVVHLKNKKGRILRELSLAEIDKESVDATFIDNIQEEL